MFRNTSNCSVFKGKLLTSTLNKNWTPSEPYFMNYEPTTFRYGCAIHCVAANLILKTHVRTSHSASGCVTLTLRT